MPGMKRVEKRKFVLKSPGTIKLSRRLAKTFLSNFFCSHTYFSRKNPAAVGFEIYSRLFNHRPFLQVTNSMQQILLYYNARITRFFLSNWSNW